ncbi:diguanylate cyclase domain-containing protein [Halonatronum saccharophilum]|uniref:diguanylate cyclase domain-containing protein n=1 Tax=Halonatronum saccharophilum TaxID=150060 RepID=UPI0004825B36|nr:diguanylate cyclase [Halonatronum saccharophilum]
MKKEIIEDRFEIKKRIKESLDYAKDSNSSFGLLFIEIPTLEPLIKDHGQLVKWVIIEELFLIFKRNYVFFDELLSWQDNKFMIIIKNIYDGDLSIVVDKLRVEIMETKFTIDFKELGVDIFIGCTLASEDDSLDSLVGRLFVNTEKID